MLNKDSYETLIHKLKNETYGYNKILQTNFFYDTQNLNLHNNDITFRIRQIENDLKVQIKLPLEKNGLFSVKKEISKKIEVLPYQITIMDAELCKFTQKNNTIFLKGSLVTERFSVKVGNNLKIDVDKNYYLGFVDYELEVELLSNKNDCSGSILSDLVGADIIPPIGGKRERFFFSILNFKDVYILE